MGILLHLTAAREDKESFLQLLLRVMEKAADLSEFDRGQIIMSRKLGTRISQTARQLTAQYNAGPSASVSEHTVQ